MSELRTCRVNGEKAFFHCWANIRKAVDASPLIGGHPGGFIEGTLAIVEYEDGRIEMVYPEEIVFLDSRHLFAQYDFTEEGAPHIENADRHSA